VGGEGDPVVGAAEGRAHRPHDGHRGSVGHHRSPLQRSGAARILTSGRWGSGDGKQGLGVLEESSGRSYYLQEGKKVEQLCAKVCCK
jgi:hypothetical protein